jgi:hypothetical protein
MADNGDIGRLFKQLEATGATFRQETRIGTRITADAIGRALLARNADEGEMWMSWMSWNRAAGK